MSHPVATVSVDVDPVDLHLVGYGICSQAPDPLVYALAVPRLLECFSRHRVRATFFVVGRDATRWSALLAGIAAGGHEVASHSLTHPFALTRQTPEVMRGEFVESRQVLERACGRPVVGFRAPNFDMTARGLDALAEAGYAYDASAYPTPWLAAARVLLAVRSRDPAAVLRLRAWPPSWRREPHAWRTGSRALIEFPISVTPGLRWPVYHTMRYRSSDARFERTLDGFVRRGEALSYALHAVDALGLVEDRVDHRLGPHPGMSWRLEPKLALLDRTLAAIARRFDPLPFRDRLTSG